MSRTRTLKPSIHTDCKTGQLSYPAYKLFTGLLQLSDDYGVLVNNILEIKAKIFPYKLCTEDEIVSPLLQELSTDGLIQYFSASVHNSKNCDYIFIKNFSKHQAINRPQRPIIPGWVKYDTPEKYLKKYPDKITLQSKSYPQISPKFTDNSLSSHGTLSEFGENLWITPEKAGQKITNSEDTPYFNNIYIYNNTNQDIISSCQRDFEKTKTAQKLTVSDAPVLQIILEDKTPYPIFTSDITNYKTLFPNLDVLTELRNAASWCLAHAQQRKTKRGILKFIDGWLRNATRQKTNIVKLQGTNYDKPIKSIAERAKEQRDKLRAAQVRGERCKSAIDQCLADIA